MAEYLTHLDRDELDTSQFDLGVELREFNQDLFRKIAWVSGDDENPPGSLWLRQYQLDFGWPIFENVLNQHRMTIYEEWPRQSTKTTTVGHVAAQLAAIPPTLMPNRYPHLKFGTRTGLYGPRADKAKKLRDKIQRILSTPFYTDVLGLEFDVANGVEIRLSNNSSIICASASDRAVCVEQPSLHLAITEETQALSETRIVKSIRPMMAATNGVTTHIGTASHEPRERGFFRKKIKEYEDALKRGIDLNKRWKDTRVYILDITDVFATPGTQNYRSYVKAEIKEWGIDHPAIQSQFFNNWDFDIGATYLRPEWLYHCRKCEMKGMERRYYGEVTAGIDVAQVRDDTVVTIYEPSHYKWKDLPDGEQERIPVNGMVRGWLQLGEDDYMKQGKAIKRYLSHYPNLLCGLIDTRGPGRALLDILYTDNNDGLPTFQMFEGDEPTESEIQQEWVDLKQRILNVDIYYPKNDVPIRHEFERQMTDLEKFETSSGRVKIDHPKKEGGKKDFPDSLRLALKAAGELTGPSVSDEEEEIISSARKRARGRRVA